jgi:hypothetical protein
MTKYVHGGKDLADEIRRYQELLNREQRVYCDFANKVARTADGFCEFCGQTTHPKIEAITH